MFNKGFISIIFDKSVLKPISLRDLCFQTQKDFNIFLISLKIELLADVKINLIDDLVVLDDLSDGKVVEHAIEIVLGKGARLEYHANLRPANDFRLVAQNGCRFDKKLTLNFLGKEAFAKVRMTCFACAQQKFNFITEQNHFVSQTSSCLCLRAVVLDSAALDCKSKIFVNHGLQEVFARQINKNLLPSSQACISTTPQLEVLSDDVKCRHGATVKTLDAEQLFYIQSRGIAQSLAEGLLIHSFLH